MHSLDQALLNMGLEDLFNLGELGDSWMGV